MSDDNLINVINLKKYFPIRAGIFKRHVGNVRAVDDVGFTVRKGETLGLVGESGCGKTTIGRTIMMLTKPTEGYVFFETPREIVNDFKMIVTLDKYRTRGKTKKETALRIIKLVINLMNNPSCDIENEKKRKICKNAEDLNNRISKMEPRASLREMEREIAKLTRLVKREIAKRYCINHQKRKSIKRIRNRLQFVFQDPFSSLDPRVLIKEIVAEPLKSQMKYLKERKGLWPTDKNDRVERPARFKMNPQKAAPYLMIFTIALATISMLIAGNNSLTISEKQTIAGIFSALIAALVTIVLLTLRWPSTTRKMAIWLLGSYLVTFLLMILAFAMIPTWEDYWTLVVPAIRLEIFFKWIVAVLIAAALTVTLLSLFTVWFSSIRPHFNMRKILQQIRINSFAAAFIAVYVFALVEVEPSENLILYGSATAFFIVLLMIYLLVPYREFIRMIGLNVFEKNRMIRERVIQMIEKVGLNIEHLYRYPHEFSGGQRQRIGIARALSVNPGFVVLDEPTSALDVSVQAQILNMLNDLQKDLGLTYLFISHDLSIIRYMCNRVVVMYLGKIVESAPKNELFENPTHPYTEALLSVIPVPDPDLKRDRIILAGDVPSPANPPAGCRFHPRCPLVKKVCSQKEPPLRDRGNSHFVACHVR